MQTVISPAESLGLSGAALDSRLKNAGRNVTDYKFARIARQLDSDIFAHGIVYERDGRSQPIRVMMRPLLVHRDQLTYVHYVCLRLTEALSRLPQLFLDQAAIRGIVPIAPEEERWLKDIWTPAHARNNPVYGRLDAVCDFTTAGWRDTLKFMEANLSGVGGIHYAPVIEQLVMRDVVPALLEQDPELAIELPQDQRDLFVQLMIDHARAIGRPSCRLCFMEPKYERDGPDEQSALIPYVADRHGLVVSHADPRELTIRDGEVFCGDIRVDIAYRDYEVRDLIALEKNSGHALDAVRLLFRENRMVSSMAGDFDHKSGFEILTDPPIAEKFFSADDCRLFHRHVLWTRLLADRRTTLPDGTTGSLLDYVRAQRERLVLKPNRGYGGQGVTIGAITPAGDWESLIGETIALAPDNSWVVQEAAQIPVTEFPVVAPDGRVHNEPFYAVMGFASTDNGLGALCRVSQKQVVNVAQYGGLAALLLGEPPKKLQIPRRPLRQTQRAKDALRKQIVELRHLDQAISLLEWDEETMLPLKGRPQRGEQISTLEGIRHALLVSDQLGDSIEEAAAQCGSDADLARELMLLRQERRRAIAVPEDIVRRLANAKSHALGAWEDARLKNDFSVFSHPFSQLLSLVRERADFLAADSTPYDALLDEYEPGMSRSRLDPILARVRTHLVPYVQNAARSPAKHRARFANRKFPVAEQWKLSRHILGEIGFDFARGRMDSSTHPFTMQGGEDDVRMTSRTEEGNILTGLLATMHEGGHALYDQGFKAGDRDSLLADGASSGMHEGQARLWENHVGRSRGFMEHLFPRLQESFPAAFDDLTADDLWRDANTVRLGTSRVGADELTYHLHIVLRFELETALLAGDLAVAELPYAWNHRSGQLLGLKPASDREGVLQDVHWAVGMFGYFPTYTIGSLYAAQLAETYAAETDLDGEIRAGRFRPLRDWLSRNVYEPGNRFSPEELMTRTTGRGLDPSAFFSYLASAQRAWNSVAS